MTQRVVPAPDSLLKEYELTLTSIHSINSVAYAATGLFVTLSLAGAAWFLRPGADLGWWDVLRNGIAATFSILLVLYWRRWLETLRTQNGVSRFRSREIEADLGLRHSTYLSDVEVLTFGGHVRCGEHGYRHSSYEEAVDHLAEITSRHLRSGLLTPFKRLWEPRHDRSAKSADEDEPAKGRPRRSLISPRTAGDFFDAVTAAIVGLWIASFVGIVAIVALAEDNSMTMMS